jgi:hypothetical protein
LEVLSIAWFLENTLLLWLVLTGGITPMCRGQK